MSIFEVVEDSEEESLEAPKGPLDRKYSVPVIGRTRTTIKRGLGFARKLQRPSRLDLFVYLGHELSEAFGQLWHQASIVAETPDLSFWTKVEFPGYRDI